MLDGFQSSSGQVVWYATDANNQGVPAGLYILQVTGDAIPNVTDDSEWEGLSTGAYCAYMNIESNADSYGYLYNRFGLS